MRGKQHEVPTLSAETVSMWWFYSQWNFQYYLSWIFVLKNGILTGRKILLTKLLAVEDQVKDPPYTAALF